MSAQVIQIRDYRRREEREATEARLGRVDFKAIEAEISAALWNSPVFEAPFTAPDKDAS